VRSWLVSLLPERTRRRLDPAPGLAPTIGTALIEMAVGLFILVTGFMAFRHELYRRSIVAGLPGLDNAQAFGYGAVMYLSFLLTLPGLVSVYLFIEGGVRALSAIYVEEPCGSLVVAGLDWAVRRWRRRRRGAARPDVVTIDGDGLVLETDRRRGWDAQTTVAHDGVYYALRAVETPSADRWRYRLGPLPQRWLIRGVRRIDD
jgi:hypothetical protein